MAGKTGPRGNGHTPVPALKALEPAAARWIGALIRMSASHPAMTRILEVFERLQDRPFHTNFLLTGEPGTGKEGLARALAQLCAPEGPVVRLDVAGLPEDEGLDALCGRGRRAGVAEQAAGGFIIIEEVAGLGRRMQLALLRLLKEGRCKRIEDARPPAQRPFGVNAIALTDGDLGAEVAAGRLRHDLYYRLARVVLWLPPLRDRVDDIAPSAVWMGNRILRAAGSGLELRTTADLRVASAVERAGAVELLPSAVEALRRHDWPGNFRELEAVIERALLLHREGNTLGGEAIRRALEPAQIAG